MNLAADSSYNLQAGTVVAGRFEVVKSLGSGSMGLVYACIDREFDDRIVAVKVLYPEVATDEISMARFRNEIVSSYRVSHPNVVRSFELVRDKDLIAYTMEYVNGGILLDYINPANLLPIPDAIKIIIEMCAGVQAIHTAGIVHRDLKPENILITETGSVKIADFGIARTSRSPKLTEHGGVVGTIDYVSPEYILESKVDWRSDIYAIGVLSYELIVGYPPFQGDNIYDVMTKRLNEDPKVPSLSRPECTPEIDAIIMKALARNLELRYQSAAELGKDLAAVYRKMQQSKPIDSSAYNILGDQEEMTSFQGPRLDPETVESLPHTAIAHQAQEEREKTGQHKAEDFVINFDRAAESPAEDLAENSAENLVAEQAASKKTQKEQPKRRQRDPNLSKTVTIGPEIVNIASYYQGVKNKNSMESVLKEQPREDQDAFDPNSENEEENIVLNTTSLNQVRTNLGQNTNSSSVRLASSNKLIFVMFVVIAIALGITSGMFLVELLF